MHTASGSSPAQSIGEKRRHSLERVVALRGQDVSPEGVRQRVVDDEAGVHAGVLQRAVEVDRAAQQDVAAAGDAERRRKVGEVAADRGEQGIVRIGRPDIGPTWRRASTGPRPGWRRCSANRRSPPGPARRRTLRARPAPAATPRAAASSVAGRSPPRRRCHRPRCRAGHGRPAGPCRPRARRPSPPARVLRRVPVDHRHHLDATQPGDRDVLGEGAGIQDEAAAMQIS